MKYKSNGRYPICCIKRVINYNIKKFPRHHFLLNQTVSTVHNVSQTLTFTFKCRNLSFVLSPEIGGYIRTSYCTIDAIFDKCLDQN